MSTVAFIFARGGSRGVLRKNLRLLDGKPLLVHAIEAAQAAALVDRVVASTDDAEIGRVAYDAGALVLVRPPELAADDSPEWLSWQHAIRAYSQKLAPWEEVTTFVSVPCTAPLRLPMDIDACIRVLSGGVDAVITVTPARRNPWYNMVTINAHTGYAYLAADHGVTYERRQDAPAVYDVTTVCYAARPYYILASPRLMMPGRVAAVIVPPDRAIDIDTELDLRIAEVLMAEREKAEVAY